MKTLSWPLESTSLTRILIGVFSLGLLLQLLSLWVGHALGEHGLWPNLPVHAAMEMAGAAMAMMVAHLLLRLDAIDEGSSFNRLIAAALIGMGCLDGLHAMLPAGNSFEWLHSAATAFGGLLFALLLLPANWPAPLLKHWPSIVLLLTGVFGAASLIFQGHIPEMLTGGAFTPSARILNVGGGILMLLAAGKLLLTFRSSNKLADLLFGAQCLLLGMAAIMFEYARLWDFPWWAWHFLRLLGYAMALWLVRISLDADGRRKAEDENGRYAAVRRDSEALLATLNLHAIVSVADRAGRITEVNDAFCRISGYSREELLGQNHRIVNSGVQDKVFWVDMWHDIANGKPWRGEVCNRAKDGSLYWVDTFIAPFVNEDGKIDRYISIRTDITASKASVRELETALRDNDALLRTLNQHAIVSVADRAGRITEVNDAFCRISGYSREELIGENHRIVNSSVQDKAFWVDMWRDIANGKPWRGEVCNRAKDGSLYWVDTFIAPFMNNDGKIDRYISIRTDISASKNAGIALLLATEQAQAAAQAKGDFLANMSHEIRTPMNAILGMLKLLQTTDQSPRQLDYTSKAEGAARSLLGLLNDILDFSKIDAGKMQIAPEPFEPDRLLRDLSVILSANLAYKPVEVLFDIDPALPEVLIGDALRLQQILINLSGNAIKFTERGNVTLQIKVLRKLGNTATLYFAVSDSGIGIAPEHQERIFDGFSQAEASTTRRFGGTGLGLSICKKLVTLMGGSLSLDSALGEGSCFHFTITLPIADQALIEPRAQLGPQDVLIVDDNPCSLALLTTMTRSCGWNTDCAESGSAAIERVKNRTDLGLAPYHAIFVDWEMPGMDGWETIAQLKQLNRDAVFPVTVMVTVHGREKIALRSVEEQASLNAFLVKPVTASMLFDAIADARTGRKSMRTGQRESASCRLEGLRLLVVEDNKINQQIAKELLLAEGAQIEMADDGQAGVEAVAIAQPQYDAVLMDLQMPVMDGYAATQAIREKLKLNDLPVIAMTANAMASDREACLSAGMNDHVGKPLDIDHLIEVVLNHTKRQKATESLPEKVSTRVGVEDELPSPDAIDVEGALARMRGNTKLYGVIVREFLDELATRPEQFEHYLEADSRVGVARLLHTVKGLSATVGASYMSAVAKSLEREFQNENSSRSQHEQIVLFREAVAMSIRMLTPIALRYEFENQPRTDQPRPAQKPH